MFTLVTPQSLAKHVPHELLWACLVEAAQRAELDKTES
jgi:hypothetical protein